MIINCASTTQSYNKLRYLKPFSLAAILGLEYSYHDYDEYRRCLSISMSAPTNKIQYRYHIVTKDNLSKQPVWILCYDY